MTVSPDGFLLIDKPPGMTSQDVVTHVRRALGASRAGHTGTLDPFATGLLVVLLGAATRLARFVPSEPKTYEAHILFGSETDTDDSTGEVTGEAPPPVEADVMEGIRRLTGEILQVPPSYSAKQVAGQRAYALAREGQPLALPPVAVRVDSWELLARESNRWRVRIRCGTGTYIRALARDLGRHAKSAAHLAALRRTSIGPFSVADALSADVVHRDTRVRPAAEALVGLPRVRLVAGEPDAVRAGRAIAARESGEWSALLDADDRLVAVAERRDETWQPRVVLADA